MVKETGQHVLLLHGEQKQRRAKPRDNMYNLPRKPPSELSSTLPGPLAHWLLGPALWRRPGRGVHRLGRARTHSDLPGPHDLNAMAEHGLRWLLKAPAQKGTGQKCVLKLACPGRWNQRLKPAIPWWLSFDYPNMSKSDRLLPPRGELQKHIPHGRWVWPKLAVDGAQIAMGAPKAQLTRATSAEATGGIPLNSGAAGRKEGAILGFFTSRAIRSNRGLGQTASCH